MKSEIVHLWLSNEFFSIIIEETIDVFHSLNENDLISFVVVAIDRLCTEAHTNTHGLNVRVIIFKRPKGDEMIGEQIWVYNMKWTWLPCHWYPIYKHKTKDDRSRAQNVNQPIWSNWMNERTNTQLVEHSLETGKYHWIM